MEAQHARLYKFNEEGGCPSSKPSQDLFCSPECHLVGLIRMVVIKALWLASLFGAALAVDAATPAIRYMPFGDSITEITCWRSKIWDKLQTTEWASVDFVGSGKQDSGSCKNTKYDRDNEGHSGFLAIDIANKKQLVGWLQKNPADVISTSSIKASPGKGAISNRFQPCISEQTT